MGWGTGGGVDRASRTRCVSPPPPPPPPTCLLQAPAPPSRPAGPPRLPRPRGRQLPQRLQPRNPLSPSRRRQSPSPARSRHRRPSNRKRARAVAAAPQCSCSGSLDWCTGCLSRDHVHITSAGRTDVGVIRSGNEDSFRMIPDRGIFVVADSRAYLLRDSRLSQLTKDHSYVQEQVDAGYLTPEQARTHPYSNVITRCVGANSDVMPDIYVGTVKRGDLFLLASDGLTGMLEDYQLSELLSPDRMPQDEVDALIAEANRHGGLDNITAIIVRIDSVEAPTQENVTTQQSPARPR